jgi:DNA-binding MurR/RpiR family transcriptional regulator
MTKEGVLLRQQSIQARIRSYYDVLTPGERRLADTILNFPGDLASYSATELASLAKVSKAATSRFFQRLGYGSYEEARREARDAQRWGSSLYMQTRMAEGRGLEESVQVHLESELLNLKTTLGELDAATLRGAVEALSGARQVACFGFRTSHAIASYARFLLLQSRESVWLLEQEGETLAEQVVNLGPKDVVLAVGLRRRLPAFCGVLDAVSAQGAHIVLIADQTAYRSANAANFVLRCTGHSPSLFDSDVSAMSIAHLLCSAVANQLGRAGRDRLKQIEMLHERLQEFE